jgi:hypothetical protein
LTDLVQGSETENVVAPCMHKDEMKIIPAYGTQLGVHIIYQCAVIGDVFNAHTRMITSDEARYR